MQSGGLTYFLLQEWQFVNEFQHVLGKIYVSRYDVILILIVVSGITKVFPDASGTAVVFIDDKCDAFVYNPVSQEQF